MADRQHVVLEEVQPVELWPPDDTEESVLGTNLHQTTIHNLRQGLNEIAAARATPGGTLPWQVWGQTMITGLQRPNGSRLTVLPDIFVYTHPVDDRRRSLALSLDGPPVLVIEVLSQATYQSDLDLVKGKGYSCARARVAEYLVLDPLGEFLPVPGRGWQLADGDYRPWEPGPSGHWRSQVLPAAFAMEGVRVAVYEPSGQRQLRMGEVAQELAAKDWEMARREQVYAEALARQERELEALRQQLARQTKKE